MDHSLQRHDKTEHLKIRRKILDDTTGQKSYQSLQFNITLQDIAQHKETGHTCQINIHEKRIAFKKSRNTNTAPTNDNKSSQTDENDVYELMPGIIEKLRDMDRLDDFKSVQKAIESWILTRNIAFHLLLDIGKFYSKKRYPI